MIRLLSMLAAMGFLLGAASAQADRISEVLITEPITDPLEQLQEGSRVLVKGREAEVVHLSRGDGGQPKVRVRYLPSGRELEVRRPAIEMVLIKEEGWLRKLGRVFDFSDAGTHGTRRGLLGGILLGVCCGLLGAFIVVRRMALFGDTLSHAVLPGVMLGFLATGFVAVGAAGVITIEDVLRSPLDSLDAILGGGYGMEFQVDALNKNPLVIFLGATVIGLLGGAVVTFIQRATRLKEDAALGLVLAVFYAVGIVLYTRIKNLGSAEVSGLYDFMFGQAALLTPGDLSLMGFVTVLALAAVTLFYKELLLTSFDNTYARVSGFPIQVIHYSLMLLLAFAVVVALQAVGVVLVSAMLITPAAAAYMLTDRMDRMLWLSAGFGILSGLAGALFSYFFDTPTGPFMVLGATFIFAMAFLFGPRHGVVMRWFRRRSRIAQVQRENTLKAVYHVLEQRGFEGEGVSLRELAERRRETEEDARRLTAELAQNDLATLHEEGNQVHLTPEGWQRACEIVRNHRLWELYLTNEAHIAPDHVHDDAEKIEHVLGEEVVRELERTLDHARTDPHGRPIPSLRDLQSGLAPEGGPTEILGFGKRL